MAIETQIPISSSIQQVNPGFLFSDGFELENSSLIPNEQYSGSFTQGLNNIEFYVYDSQQQVQYSDYNFTDYQITQNSNAGGSKSDNNFAAVESNFAPTKFIDGQSSATNIININPETDIYNSGYTNGTLYRVYNFVNLELSSSNDNRYYISEISGDRTEIRIKSNYLSAEDMLSSYILLEDTLNAVNYFDEFYITFGQNEYHIGVNSQFISPLTAEANSNDASILIKLFDALPAQYTEMSELYVVTKTAETQVFEVQFQEDLSVIDDTIALQGPNINLDIKDFINNSTTYKNKDELLGTKSSGSKNQTLQILEQKGIALTPYYSTSSFDQFVNFSSAKQRTQNFYEKVTRIQSYEDDINTLNYTTASNPTSQVSKSIASLYTQIENEIKAFDGWDYYLYYNTASDSYPKDLSDPNIFPYPLLNTGSVTVLNWLGSDIENDQYYGGVLYSASRYDNDNQNYLYYTIPTFITEQNNNDNYVEFVNMVGQSFDELWLYTKTVTAKLNTTNVLDEGVPLSLADDVITSLGYTGFGNNYNNQDNFIGLAGNDDGIYVPPTGSELILNYIAINNGEIINYWQTEYAWEDYVEQLIKKGFPYPIDAVSKEIFKRLYHNMAYLVKKKGTISGLRQLINIWGIPNTILRINEFGGKNKDQTDDYDLWYDRYSYAYTPVANSYRASASAIIPWMPLERNRIADGGNAKVVPDGLAFRFKTTGYPSSSFAGSFNTASLAIKKSNGQNDKEFDWGIMLNYTGSTSGSYQGAGNSDYRNWAEMKLYISGAAADGGNAISDPIYLPFYDGGWWSVLLQRNQHVAASNNSNRVTYTLYAKNKIYNGNDGNSLGFQGSASIDAFDVNGAGVYGTGLYGTALYGAEISSSLNYAWNKFGVTEKDGVYLGGKIDGATVGTLDTNLPGQAFSGSFQEFRYYSNDISESVFNDFVMNPESIEGNFITGSESSFDIVNFRAPLGNELENIFSASYAVTNSAYNEYITSSHPAVTASADELITGSFHNPFNGDVTSNYHIRYEKNENVRIFSKTNTETYFLDQAAIGFRNRISNKIQSTKDLNFGTVLSGLVSIEKDPFISQSYTENLNQLEVAFSPQDEINDDIIQSLGYGAIQEILADPRFADSSDLYYPKLRKIAEDYFKKYAGSNVYDYLRLIKYFDDSLFKAIKNYVPARTSVSTGIVIHQNMLERNRYRQPQVDSYTTQSYAITNIPLTAQNLELTGSIEMYEMTGSTGGSLNKYNITSSQFGYYGFSLGTITSVLPGEYVVMNNSPSAVSAPGQSPTALYGNLYAEKDSDLFNVPSAPLVGYLKSTEPVKASFSFNAFGNFGINNTDVIEFIISSSVRGEIYNHPTGSSNQTTYKIAITPLMDIMPDEALSFMVKNITSTAYNLTNFTVKTFNQNLPQTAIELRDLNIMPDISSSAHSSQGYIEYNTTNVGLLGEAVTNQEEFYDGEFSGSTFDASTRNVQYNPFKKVNKDSVVPWIFPTSDLTLSTQQNVRFRKSTNLLTDFGSLGVPNLLPSGVVAQTYVNVTINPTSGTATGTLKAAITVGTGFGLKFITDIIITDNLATPIVAGDDFEIPIGELGAAQVSAFQLNDVSDNAICNFESITSDGFNVNNSGNNFFIFLIGQPTNIINLKYYKVSFDLSNYNGIGRVGFGSDASDGTTTLWANLNIAAKANGPFSASLQTAFVPNGETTLSAKLAASPGFIGTVSNFSISPDYAADPSWNEVVADVYLNPLQQDQWQVENTQSIIFENSDYNPLNNNVNINRSSSTRLLLSYNDEQYQPENFQNVVTYSLNNTSQSVFADIPDSNYTKPGIINPRYNGSELQSLDYNHFTPSGTVGQPLNLPVQPYNKKAKGQTSIQTSVALSFLNGSTQSQETGLAAWEGDNSYGKTAVIDKNPIYIAHFQDSFEQLNYWDSSQFNIDSLILIPSESIQGKQGYTPQPILIDGNNQSKKIVSSTFEPNRKVAVSYDALNTAKLNFSTQQSKDGFGKSYTLGGGAIRFLTLNSNERTRSTTAVSWSYSLRNTITASRQGNANLVNFLPAESTFNVTQFITSSTNINVNSNIFGGTGYIPASNVSTISSAGATTMKVDILDVDKGGVITDFVISNNNAFMTGYSIGDVVTIVQNIGTQNATATFTFDTKVIKGFLMSGSLSKILYSQNNSLKSSDFFSNVASDGFLEVEAPQLVNFHTYNRAISEERFNQQNSQNCVTNARDNQFTGPTNAYFINRGQNPSNPENYYKWNPSGSGMREYENTDTPFLIQRGDILRVEGFTEKQFQGNITADSNFIEDFTIMDTLDYYYSSSVQLLSLNVGDTAYVNGQGSTSGQLYNTYNSSTGLGVNLVAGNLPATVAGTFTANLGTGGAVGTFTSDGSNIVEAYVSVSGSTGNPVLSPPPTIVADYAVGDIFQINGSPIGAGTFFVVIAIENMKSKVDQSTGVSILVSDTGSDNPFKMKAVNGCGSAYTSTQAGYYPVRWPSFLVTDRDPEIVLNGVSKGEIKRFTLRRQIEDDSSVMIYNIEPPTIIPTVTSSSYSGVLRLGSIIGSLFYEFNTTTGISNGTEIVSLLPSMTDGNGLGGKVTVTISGGKVTQIAFSDVAESFGWEPGDKLTLTAGQIGASPNVGAGTVVCYLSTKNVLLSGRDKAVGASAVSSQGFLIPNDLSFIQKQNALTIINEMRSKNSFPQDISNAGNGAGREFSGIDVTDPDGF